MRIFAKQAPGVRRRIPNTVLVLILLAPICVGGLTGCSNIADSERSMQALSEVAEADRQYDLGQVDAGRKWIEKALGLSRDGSVFVGQGEMGSHGVIEVLSNHGDYTELAKVLKPVVANNKLDVQEILCATYGDTLYRLGKTSEAKSVYAGLLGVLRKKYPTLGQRTATGRPAQLAIAEAELQSGDLVDAAKDYDAVRRLNFDIAADAANSQAYLSSLDGVDLPHDLKLAQFAVAKATAQDDQQVLAEYEDTLGWIYYKMWTTSRSKSDIEQAITHLERGVIALPEQGDCVFHLARAYEANGQIDDARIEYQRLANLWPANPQAIFDAKRLGNPMTVAPAPPQDDEDGKGISV